MRPTVVIELEDGCLDNYSTDVDLLDVIMVDWDDLRDACAEDVREKLAEIPYTPDFLLVRAALHELLEEKELEEEL